MKRSTAELVDPALRHALVVALHEQLGLSPATCEMRATDAALRRLATLLCGGNLAALLERTRAGDAVALAAFADELTVAESYFFRHPPHFDALRQLLSNARAEGRRVRLWSAGCAGGEEAYSMAISACEVFGNAAAVEVVATDLSPASLTRARAGVYRPWALRGTDEAFRQRWFRPTQSGLMICDEVRALVTFAVGNLLRANEAPPAIDIAFCRNVLIYFDDHGIAAIGDSLATALEPGGWLVLGPADPLLRRAELAVDSTYGFIGYRRRNAAAIAPQRERPRRPAVSRPRQSRRPRTPSAASPPAAPPELDATLLASARRAADRGELAEARVLVDRVLAAAPVPAAYVLRAELASAVGDYEAVELDARRALLLDRQLIIAQVLLATAHANRGNRAAAARGLALAVAELAALPPEAPIRGATACAADVLSHCRQLARALRLGNERESS